MQRDEDREEPYPGISLNDIEWDLLNDLQTIPNSNLTLSNTNNNNNNNNEEAQPKKQKRERDANTNETKKQKREQEWKWEIYHRNPSFPLFNSLLVNLTPHLLFSFYVGKNTTYSPEEECWIHYKNNHFQIEVTMTCRHELYSTPLLVLDENSQSALQVENLFVELYAIRTLRELDRTNAREPEPEDIVPLYEVDSSRSKANQKPPSLHPIGPGVKASFYRLRFDSATANVERRKIKGPAKEQEFYRVVVRLKAKISMANTYVPIVSYVSDPLIVRGQNPRRYGKSKTTTQNETQLSSTNPTPSTVSAHSFSSQLTWDSTSEGSDVTPTSLISPRPSLSPSLSPQSTSPNLSPPSLSPSPSPNPSPATHNPTTPSNYFSSPNLSPSLLHSKNSSYWEANLQNESISFHGKVGINTNLPQEALSVAGNVVVTGTIAQPSDQRVKKNIRKVDTAEMLNNVTKLQIHDYEWKDEWREGANVTRAGERGVIAQQLQEVLPAAVSNIGKMNYGDDEIDNMLVVSEKALLMENIGATQELAHSVAQLDTRMRRVERMRKFYIPAMLACVLCAAFAWTLYFFVLRPHSQVQVTNFPYKGKWQSLDGKLFMEIVVEEDLVSVSVNSSDFWISGPMASFDQKRNPPQFSVAVASASYKFKYFDFIFEPGECPQFLKIAFNPSGKGYPESFQNGIVMQKYFPKTADGLPVLNTVNEFVFCKLLSCGGASNTSALFLSDFSAEHKEPDLIFDGDCPFSCFTSYFIGSSTSANFSLISDLGPVKLQQVIESDTIRNTNYSSKASMMLSHTYTVFGMKTNIRYLMAFTVTKVDPILQHVFVNWTALSYALLPSSFPSSFSPSSSLSFSLHSSTLSCNANNSSNP